MEVITIIVGVVTAIFAAIVGPIFVYHYTKHQEKKLAESKTIINYGDTVAIRTFNGQYVTSNRDNDGQLIAKTRQIRLWETYVIVMASEPFSEIPDRPVHYGDQVAFKAVNSESFVSANLHANGELKLNVPWVREWETFTLYTPDLGSKRNKAIRYGESFALKAQNGKYVRFNADATGRLVASVEYVRAWETFVFKRPPNTDRVNTKV